MKLHAELDQDQFARLVDLAAGTVPASDARDLERHAQACATCRNALAWLRPTLDSLHFAPPPAEPAADVFGRIERALAAGGEHGAQPWKAWRAEPEVESALIRQAAASAWRPTSVDGVEVRELAVDPDNASVTMLIRMAAGASYPAHEHGGAEECYVLQGDLVIGELTMRGGDFQRMEAGTRHPVQRTEGGCLLFLRSSTDDRLLEVLP
jgi:anti-sigma factor ChrR (cupin superfamily)